MYFYVLFLSFVSDTELTDESCNLLLCITISIVKFMQKKIIMDHFEYSGTQSMDHENLAVLMG